MDNYINNFFKNDNSDKSDDLKQFNIDNLDSKSLDELEEMVDDSFLKMEDEQQKRWLFKENIRLKELDKNLEDERKLIEIQMGMLQRQQSKNMLLKKQLEGQKNLFDQKWNILERETRQLALDKEKFDREKLIYKDKVYREARRSMANAENVKIFFKGVDDTDSLKKRYKQLLKIFHPDNMNGDKDLLQAINTEYEKLTRFYLGT